MNERAYSIDTKSLIEVENVTPLDACGALCAFVSVRIGGLSNRDFRIIQQEGQMAWVSVPQSKGKDGNFYNFVDFIDSAILRFTRQKVLSA